MKKILTSATLFILLSHIGFSQINPTWSIMGINMGKNNKHSLELGNYEIALQNDSTEVVANTNEHSNNFADYAYIHDKGTHMMVPTKNHNKESLSRMEKRALKYRDRGFIHFRGKIGNFELSRIMLDNPDYSNYPTAQHNFLDLKGSSLRIDANIFSLTSNTTQRFRISTAIGLTWENYVWEDNIHLENNGDLITPVYPTETTYKKSKLMNFGLHIPIQIFFNFSRDFYLSAGVYGNWFFKQHCMVKNPKERYNIKGVNDLRGGLVANIGCNWFYVTGRYALTPIFKKGEGPKVAPCSIGIGVSIQELFNL